MDVIKEEIQGAIEKELTAANEKNPLFASLHEAYAVIKEEKEEAMDEFADIERFFSMGWSMIKQNQPKLALNHLRNVGHAAERLAIEACQVAAMCKKAVISAENPISEKLEDQELKDALY